MRSYLKEQVDKIMAYLFKVERRTLLWTNPSPDSAFPAQNINVDLSDYDEVEVIARHWSNNGTIASARCKTTELGCILVPNGASAHMAYRDWQGYADHIYMAQGRDFYGTSMSYSDYAGIPLCIYGIKLGGVLRSPVVSRLCAILKIGGGVDERRPQGADRPVMLQNQSCGQQDQHSRQRCYKWLVLEEVVGWYIRSVVEHKRDSDKFQYIPRLHASNSYTNSEFTSSWVWQRICCLLLPRLEQRRDYIWERKHKRQLRRKPLRSLQGVTISERRWAA